LKLRSHTKQSRSRFRATHTKAFSSTYGCWLREKLRSSIIGITTDVFGKIAYLFLYINQMN
ncbi:hypothetical protein L9F63_013873, partial [Diploptera punctata]